MKSKILIGVEFIIFIALLGIVIIYSQVLIKKVIDGSAVQTQEQQIASEEQKIHNSATTTDENTASVDAKYAWLAEQEANASTSSSTAQDDKRAYLKQVAPATNAAKPLSVEEKMKFLEQN